MAAKVIGLRIALGETVREIWKAVPKFEGRYAVSNMGRVKSLDRVQFTRDYRTTSGVYKAASLRKFKGKLLSPSTCASGHLAVVIGKGNTRLVHQLVLEAFVGPRPEGFEVLHLNHTPSDNRLVNLRYGTRSENIRMDHEAGTRKVHPGLAGSRWRKAKR